MSKPVAILGCGPAGLMAAQAVVLSGREAVILSRPVKSKLGGAQFLHMPIAGINDAAPDRVITYRKRGDEATYRKKVYGEEYVPFTSFASVQDGETQEAWNLIETYDRLWEQFGGMISDVNVGPQWLDDHLDEFDLIFSTVPLPAICRARAGLSMASFHSFRVQNIHVATESYGNWSWGDDTIVYDGTNERTWYRASKLFGVSGTEWSDQQSPPPVGNLVRDSKPVGTTCDCYRDRVIRLGRRGTWTKGVLTHDAFLGVLEVIA